MKHTHLTSILGVGLLVFAIIGLLMYMDIRATKAEHMASAKMRQATEQLILERTACLEKQNDEILRNQIQIIEMLKAKEKR